MNEIKSESDKIIDVVQKLDKYKTNESLTNNQRDMVKDIIRVSLLLDGQSIDSFDIELKENAIVFTDKSYFEEKCTCGLMNQCGQRSGFCPETKIHFR